MENFFQLVILIVDLFRIIRPITKVGVSLINFIELFIVLRVGIIIVSSVCRLGALLLPLVGILSS